MDTGSTTKKKGSIINCTIILIYQVYIYYAHLTVDLPVEPLYVCRFRFRINIKHYTGIKHMHTSIINAAISTGMPVDPSVDILDYTRISIIIKFIVKIVHNLGRLTFECESAKFYTPAHC